MHVHMRMHACTCACACVHMRMRMYMHMHRGFALAEMGAPPSLWSRVCTEGHALWARMTPGRTESADGASGRAGTDPSGDARGDRYIPSSHAPADDDSTDGGGSPGLALVRTTRSRPST